MFKKLLFILSFNLLCNTGSNAQIIENFESGPTSLNSSVLRNQNGIYFNILDCNISPVLGNVFSPPSTVNSPTVKGTTVTQGNLEPLLLGHGVLMDVVAPNGGKYALRLNDVATNNYDISTYTKEFIAKGEYVSFDYMAVLDSPHFNDLNVQPFFSARLLDMNNNVIPNTQFCLIADTNDPLLSNPNADLLFTRGWFCGLLKIPKKYIGKKIKVQFIAADCGLGGDIGVSYVDNVVNEIKCDKPTYGYVHLNEVSYPCPRNNFEVCGTYSAPIGSTLQSLVLQIKKNGVVINTINITNNGSYNGNSFCFVVAPEHFGNLIGDFEFNVIATFVAPNGFKYVLNHESSIDGPDVSCGDCPEENVTRIEYHIEGINHSADFISWPAFGNGNYHVQLSQDYKCCGISNLPNDNIVVDYYTTINGFNTEDAGYFYYNNGQGASNPKCYRWRVKIDECTWSEWCCVSITGTYDAYDCKRSTDDFFTSSPRPAAVAYPNPTNDFVIIENSEARIFDVYDLNNQKVSAKYFNKDVDQIKIDLHNLKPGIYIIKSNLDEEFKIIKK